MVAPDTSYKPALKPRLENVLHPQEAAFSSALEGASQSRVRLEALMRTLDDGRMEQEHE